MKKIILPIAFLLLLVVGIVFRVQLLDFGREAWSAIGDLIARISHPQSETGGALIASGAIEARTVDIASPTGGRIVALHVGEGQSVTAGELIAEMDTSLLDAGIAEAEAATAATQAQVALLRAGAREVDLAVARAAVSQAEAARATAYTGWQDALALVDAPGELDVQIAGAAAALEAATEQAQAAQAGATAADLEQQLWGRIVRSLQSGFDVPLPIPSGGTTHIDAPAEQMAYANLQWNLASQRTWQAHASHVAALAARDAARQTLADLRSQRAEPLALDSQAEVAAATHTLAEAAVKTAAADVALLEAGAAPEQIAAAETLVAQAQAAVAALETKRAQARVVAAEDGVVTAVILHGGEVAGSGTPIVRLADLTEVTLTVYVPEPRLGEVQLGQAIGVSVDAFPGRAFTGSVTHIAGSAEFTPKNVQSREERATTVFAVKIVLPNPDAALKPGMPADANFSKVDPEMKEAPDTAERSQPQPAPALYAGVVEATEVRVAAEMSGRVVRTHGGEGDAVTAGQLLAELDGEELAARRVQAEAALATARAELERVAAAPQPARIARAQAAVGQAEAALGAAQATLASAQTLRDHPQELDARINSARGQMRTAAAAIDAARAGLKTAQVLQESLQNPGSDEDRTRRAMYDQNVIAAEAALRAAQAQERGVKAVLAQLLAIRERPVAADAAIHRAEGAVAQAQAALTTAQAALTQARAPAQPEAVAIAQAKVAQAEAALATVNATAAKLAVRSPIDGIISVQAVYAGEVTQPGAPIFSVMDLRQVKLTIYVPTGQIGQVRLGQVASVTADAYPGRTFTGQVIRIADEAEFTPKNVQTQEERVKTVFAVEIALDNQDGLLKSGMPADAVLES